jgi:hypothetical protein
VIKSQIIIFEEKKKKTSLNVFAATCLSQFFIVTECKVVWFSDVTQFPFDPQYVYLLLTNFSLNPLFQNNKGPCQYALSHTLHNEMQVVWGGEGERRTEGVPAHTQGARVATK